MKNQKGITLVALIITIIVMLILVAVSVAVLIDSDLLGTAKNAGEQYRTNMDAEENMSINDVKINVDGVETQWSDYNQTITSGV